jgi:hypothetical protein
MLRELDLTFYPHFASDESGAIWVSLPNEDTAAAAWLWSPIMWFTLPAGLDSTNDLTAAGWERTSERELSNASPALWHLWGQLADVRMVQMAGQPDDREVWARSADLRKAAAAPVALAFTVPLDVHRYVARMPSPAEDTQSLRVAQVLPPPQFGEVGLVYHERTPGERGWQRYNREALGDEAQARQSRLGDALRELAGAGEWWPLTRALQRCASPGYARAKQDLQSRLAATRGKEHERLRAELAELEEANTRYKTLREARHAHKPEPWLERWEEVRQMAQQLAADYWEVHVAWQAAAPTAPQTEPRRRGPRAPRSALVVKDPAAVQIPSHIFAQGIIRSLLDGSEYTRYEDRGIAEYRRPLAKRKGAEITITLEPGDGEGWDHVLRSLNTLGDEIADTFCAHLALAIDIHGVENITAPMWVNTDDILRICQRKQSNRAYTPEQRAAVVEHQRIIARAHVRASWPTGRRGREYRIDSAIWDVFGQAVGEYKTITGEPVWERRQVKIGEWARLLPPLSKETAIMLRKVLEYHSQRDRYAKRLGRYLTLQFRVNAKSGGTVERKMGTLLEQAGITPDLKNPGRTRTMIEDALVRLKADSVIGEYRLVIDASPQRQAPQEQIEQRARKWWEVYEVQLWQVEPPEHVREQYRNLLRAPADEGEDEGE